MRGITAALVCLLFVLAPRVLLAQTSVAPQAPTTPDDNALRRLSVQLAAGATIPSGNDGGGNAQLVSVGYSPTPKLTVLVNGGRTDRATHIRYFSDGSSTTRGGTLQFVSGDVRFTLRSSERITPYALVGAGFGVWRPDAHKIFTHADPNKGFLWSAGGGLAVPLGPHVRLSGDVGFIVFIGEREAIQLILPLRVGVAWRF